MRIQSTLAGLRGIWQPAFVARLDVELGASRSCRIRNWTGFFHRAGSAALKWRLRSAAPIWTKAANLFFRIRSSPPGPSEHRPTSSTPTGSRSPISSRVEIGADVPPGFYEAQLVGRHGVSTVRVFHVTDFAELADSGNNHAIEQAQPLALGAARQRPHGSGPRRFLCNRTGPRRRIDV